MSTSTASPPRRSAPGRAHGVPTHPALLSHRRRVLRWALAHGHPIERDALAVIVALRAERLRGEVDRVWTAAIVEAVVRHGAQWCMSNRVASPVDLTPTLGTYVRYLSSHRLLADGSDSATELRRAISERRPSERASRRRHPAGSGARLAPVLPIG